MIGLDSMSGKISRRRYLKYIGAGLAVTAGVVGGAYYYPVTQTAPAHTETPTSNPSATSQNTATPISASTQTSTTTEKPKSTTYSRQQMRDIWKGVMFVQWLRENDRYIELGMKELKSRVPGNGISLFVPYYTESPTSDKIQPIYHTRQYGTPWYGHRLVESWPPELIERTLDLAHQLGFRVAYWPNVGPITEGWPWEGALEPTPGVLKAYQEFKAEQAALAEKHQCESFWIGNEWNKSYEHGSAWSRS